MDTPKTLTLALKREYFDQVAGGTKFDEFRLVTPFWERRLQGAEFVRVVITLGYPAKDDRARRLEFRWDGVRRTTLQHPLFGAGPVEVFAISLRRPLQPLPRSL